MIIVKWFLLSMKVVVKDSLCRILDWPFFFQPPYTWMKPRLLSYFFGANIAPNAILYNGVRAVNWRNVRLEDGVHIGSRADLRSHGPITIGPMSMVGPEAMLISGGHRKSDLDSTASPIVIGRGVFIGARAVILEGVTIGDHAMIGAGAVVAKEVPPRAVVVGNPAKIIGYREEPELIWSIPGIKDLKTGELVKAA